MVGSLGSIRQGKIERMSHVFPTPEPELRTVADEPPGSRAAASGVGA
jgi:hypothetical protein